jgi:hypothetical protein
MFVLAEQEADVGLIVRSTHPVVHRRLVEVHLAGEFRLERLHLQLDDYETPDRQVIEEQIEIVVLAAHFQMHLPADERKAHTKFEQEFLNMPHQSLFQVALTRLYREGQKVEGVRVLQSLLRQIRLWRRQGPAEIGHRLSRMRMGMSLDLHGQDGPAPAMRQRLVRLPVALTGIFQLSQE